MTNGIRDFTPRVEIVPDEYGLRVDTYFDKAGTHRKEGGSIGLVDTPANRKLAARLKQAIEAGVVYPNPTVARDRMGQTYVAHDYTVVGRTLDIDLRKLGY
jgi:hypothetical protein